MTNHDSGRQLFKKSSPSPPYNGQITDDRQWREFRRWFAHLKGSDLHSVESRPLKMWDTTAAAGLLSERSGATSAPPRLQQLCREEKAAESTPDQADA